MLILELGQVETLLEKRQRRMTEETGITPKYYYKRKPKIKQPVKKPIQPQKKVIPKYSWWDNLLWSLRKAMSW